MGTGGVLFLVPTMNRKNTLAICLGTCSCDMNCVFEYKDMLLILKNIANS